MKLRELIYILFLAFSGTSSYSEPPFASGSHNYEQFVEELAKQSRKTAEAVIAAAEDTQKKLELASDLTKNGLFSNVYPKAVKDAEKFGPQKVSNKLTSITPENINLTWNNTKDRVLMVSWMPEWAANQFYRSKIGQEYDVTRDMWVTANPEIKKFIKNYSGPVSLHYRLQQLLGLPFSKTTNYFVESWVSPADLMRPCVDPEVDDNKCEHDSAPQKTGDAKHMRWFNNEKSGKYTGQWQFPWTRLGYTYDLAKEGDDKFGISEFVIRPGAKIIIHKIIATDQYKNEP